ncbi:MAG: restriction endonuclease subunit S [Bacteroidales bacterium]|nr:restriction endonuclease subunit S [Bacteroidales bacterium]
MKIKDICRLVTKSSKPSEDIVYHLYSLPAFDEQQQYEEIQGCKIQSNKWEVPNKCILFNKLNVRFKRVWRINSTYENKLASTEFLPLVVDENIVDYQYFYYLLISDTITNYLCGQNSNTSGSHKRIEPSDFLDIEVQLPPMDRQQEIGRILGDIDNKINLNRQINQNLEALARQLYDYWFVQFDFPDANGKPYKSSGGKMVWNDQLKREIPEGWEYGVLIDIAHITMGQSPNGSSYNEIGEGVIFYQGSTDFGVRFPMIRQYTTAPSRLAKKGDILMSVRAPIGAINIANNDCCIGRGLSAFSPKIGSTTHLYYILNDLRIAFDQRNSVGTTFGSITKEDLYNLPIVIPSKEVVSTFDKICSPIFDRQMALGEEIQYLTKQRDELLPLLMNGQVSINSTSL